MIRNHVRSNIVGYVAVFLALTGTATALNGSNTVFSDDITDGEVKSADVATNAIRTTKIGPGQVRNADLGAGAVDGAKVADASLTGSDVANDTLDSSKVTGLNGSDVQDDALTGADVAEGTLGQVPAAAVAGIGRSGSGGACDPEGPEDWQPCASVTIGLPSSGRVLVHGYGNGYTESDSDRGNGKCSVYTSATGGFGDVSYVQTDDNSGGEFGITVVTPALGPGTVEFRIDCAQDSPGAIRFAHVGLSAVQIGPS